MNITEALLSLRPGAQWSLSGDDYDGLEWLEPSVEEGGQEKPTQEEVETEVQKLQQEWENVQYQRLRAPEYPDLKEFVDAYYWSQKGDETKMNEYIVKCDEIKNKYPKPQ